MSQLPELDPAPQLEDGPWRFLFAQPVIGMATAKPGGVIAEANQRFCDILGYSVDELVGRSFNELTYAGDRATSMEHLQRLLSGTAPYYILEKRYVRKDGGLVWCRTIVCVSRDARGRPSRFLGFIEDVTERKKAYDAFVHLNSVLEMSHEAIFTTSLDGMITSWNPGAERMLGYSPDEVIGQPGSMLLPAGRLPEQIGLLAAVREARATRDLAAIRRHKNGSLVVVSLSMMPLQNCGGEIVGASVVAKRVEHPLA